MLGSMWVWLLGLVSVWSSQPTSRCMDGVHQEQSWFGDVMKDLKDYDSLSPCGATEINHTWPRIPGLICRASFGAHDYAYQPITQMKKKQLPYMAQICPNLETSTPESTTTHAFTLIQACCSFFRFFFGLSKKDESQGDNDHRRQDAHVFPALDQVVDPCANGTEDQEKSPVLHQVLGHHTTVTTNPIADVFTIHLVAHVILNSFDDGVEQQWRRDVEELSGSPNVVHGQPNHFVGLHTCWQCVAQGWCNDHSPA